MIPFRRTLPAAFLAAGLLVPAVAAAEPVHGVAMHGAPKYGPDARHLDYANPDAPKGGTIRHAATGTFDSLNPWIVKGKTPPGLEGVYESLMARVWDEPFSLYCLICETVDMPEDRSWVEFRLRPEARWHDGTPITVDDVIFSFETLREKGRPNHRSTYGKVETVERVGDRGVRFAFKAPEPGKPIDRELALIMGLMPVLPKHYWEGRTFDETTLEPPLGSGPYRIASVEPGRSIAYERVPDYWGADLLVRVGHNNFDTVRYDFYRDDGVALEAFKAGEVDFRREWDIAKWATSYDFPAAKDGRVKLEQLPHGRVDQTRALIFNTRRPIFEDRRVREALNHAFDFEWMNRNLFHSAYQRTSSFYPNSELAARGAPSEAERAILEPFRDELPPEVFERAYEPPKTDGSGPSGLRANLRTAQALLAEAGWTIQDGRLRNADGKPFTFEILLGSAGDEKLALEYARALDRLGIEANVRTVDSAQFQERLNNYDYDMLLYRWISTLSPGNEQLFYFGSASADQPGTRNYAGIKSRAVDEIAASIGTSTDRQELVDRVRALDRVLTWGHYMVPLHYLGTDQVAYWDRIERPETNPSWGVVIETWWADPAAN